MALQIVNLDGLMKNMRDDMEIDDVEMATCNLSRKPGSLSGQDQSSHKSALDNFSNSLSLSTGFLAEVFAVSRRLFRICGLADNSPCFWHGPGQLPFRDETDPYEEEDEEWDDWSDEE